MQEIEKDGIIYANNGKITPEEQHYNMSRCAEFMARMIIKYGKDVLAEIEAEEQEQATQNK